MEKNNIRHFLKKILLFLIPLWLIIAIYIILDPFKVIWEYNTFYEDGKPCYVCVDHDYVSTKVFERTYPEYHYDSFILGSSRSRFWPIEEWKKHIGESNCYHFDGSGETLYGVHKKIKYLDDKTSLKHVLLIMDHELLGAAERKTNHISYLAPQLDGHAFDFQLTFLKTFCSPDMLTAYTQFRMTGVVPEWAKKKYILDDRPMNYQLKGNEMSFRDFEDSIREGMYYNNHRMKAFQTRDTTRQQYSDRLIQKAHYDMLLEIHSILKKHHSNYKIVISPLYDQIKLNSEDLKDLKAIFGAQNVYDYSGINAYTNNYRNYYESSHYRPVVAIDIMNQIYSKKANQQKPFSENNGWKANSLSMSKEKHPK